MTTWKQSRKLLLLLLLIWLVVGGYYFYKTNKEKNTLKTDWGETYFVYLKDFKNNYYNGRHEYETAKEDGEYDIKFYNIDNYKEPIMVAKYEYNDNTFLDIFYIDNNEVKFTKVIGISSDIKLLYDVEKKDYDYFIKMDLQEGAGNIYYLKDYIDAAKADKSPDVYKDLSPDNATSKYDQNGKSLPIYRYDKDFIEVEEKDNSFHFSINDDEKTIKKNLINNEDNINIVDKNVTEEVKTDVEKKLNEIVEKQKKLEEEAAKAIEEQKKKSFTKK